MNFTKLTAATMIALSVALPAGNAFSQDKGDTVDQNLNQAEKNIDNVGENLKDAGGALGNSVENTGEAAGQGLDNAAGEVKQDVNQAADATEEGVNDAAVAIKEKSNWGWLGLLGLLGLFGLAGNNKRTRVVEHRRDLEPLDRGDTTTYVK